MYTYEIKKIVTVDILLVSNHILIVPYVHHLSLSCWDYIDPFKMVWPCIVETNTCSNEEK